jgi:hypothetical protein
MDPVTHRQQIPRVFVVLFVEIFVGSFLSHMVSLCCDTGIYADCCRVLAVPLVERRDRPATAALVSAAARPELGADRGDRRAGCRPELGADLGDRPR